MEKLELVKITERTVFDQALARWQQLGRTEEQFLRILPPLFGSYVDFPEEQTNWPWPLTVRQAVDHLLLRSTLGTKLSVRDIPKDKLIRLHFSSGLSIRNTFGLWQGNTTLCKAVKAYDLNGGGKAVDVPLPEDESPLQGNSYIPRPVAYHPDSISMSIAEAFWIELQTYDWPELKGDLLKVRLKPEEGRRS